MLKGENGQPFTILSYESLERILFWYFVCEVEMQNEPQDDAIFKVLSRAKERGIDIAITKDCT